MAKKLASDKHEHVQPQVPPPSPSPEERGAPNRADQSDNPSPYVSPGDVFANIKKLRLRQTFDRAKISKPLATVGMRKPKKHEWFQCHPDPEFAWQGTLFLVEDDGMNKEWFFPTNEEVLTELENLSVSGVREVCVYWWINRKKNTFVWPVGLLGSDGKQNDWHASMQEMMSVYARGQWCRIEAGDGGYIPEMAESADLPAPDWPKVGHIGDVLRVAFKKGGRVIDNLDHPLFARLAGRE